MTMTPEQAKEKHCPFVKGSPPRSSPGEWVYGEAALCQAGDCMAWRWDGERGFCGLAGRP